MQNLFQPSKDSKKQSQHDKNNDFKVWQEKIKSVHQELKNKLKPFEPHAGRVVLLNPQGAVGNDSIKFMNYPGTTCMGGQIPFVINLAKGMSDSFPDKKVTILSQRVTNDFKRSFTEGIEKNVERTEIHPKGDYIDKEDVANGKNQFYPAVSNWGRDLAKNKYNVLVPGSVIMNYWDSFVAFTNMMDEWKKNDVKKAPHAVAIPHSLGYRKLVSLVTTNAEKLLQEGLKQGKINSTTDIENLTKKAVELSLEKLMNDQKYLFPARILSERLMFAQSHIKGCLNSETELNKQLYTGPYIEPSSKYPSAIDNSKNHQVINPGIDTEKFGIDKVINTTKKTQLLVHEAFAKEFFDKRLKSDIDTDRKDLPVILGLGRLNKDKNFQGLAKAFKEDITLNDRANLVFVINGSNPLENHNYIKEMQDMLKKNGEEAVLSGKVTLDKFQGSNLEELVHLAKILDVPELKGKWTSVSLPNGNDYAGLQRYLGKNSKAVGGLYSFEEPYGLAPFETANCGIPVVVSNGSGAAKELIAAGAKSFNPHIHSEISKSLNETFDNLSEIRKIQLEYTKSKSWTAVGHKYMDILNKEGSSNFTSMDKINSSPINPSDPIFVEDGKNLIRKAIEKEIAGGRFSHLTKTIKAQVKI